MSAVRMCDNCGNLFSVNDEGWKTYLTRVSENEGNHYNVGAQEMDLGPCCNGRQKVRKPVIRAERELESGEGSDLK